MVPVAEILNNIYTQQIMDHNGQRNSNLQEHSGQTRITEQPAQPSDVTEHEPQSARSFRLVALIRQLPIKSLKTRISPDTYTHIKVGLYLFAVALAIGYFLFWKFYINGMVAKSVTVGGYSYSFSFPRSAKFTQFGNGMRGYTIDNDHSALVGPVSGLPQLCAVPGSPYATAFKVQLAGAILPVCTTQDSQEDQIYTLNFTAQNQYHEFMVTYGYSQNPKDYPKLKSIFESITVSK
jgi:hypothetical protein